MKSVSNPDTSGPPPPDALRESPALRQGSWSSDCSTSVTGLGRHREESSPVGHNSTCLPFSFREWLGDFAGVLDEKLRGGAERAILQGDNSDWHVGMLQFNGQDLDVRTFGKTQYRPRDNRKKAPGRQETDPHRGVNGENSRARILESAGAKRFQISRPKRAFRRGQQPRFVRQLSKRDAAPPNPRTLDACHDDV